MLSKQAKDALDEIAAQLKNQHGYVIEVQGFSSGQGQAAIANSRKMADSVVRYLVLNHEIPAYRIYVIGMGNAPCQAHERYTRRNQPAEERSRADCQTMKNGVFTCKKAWILAGGHLAQTGPKTEAPRRRGQYLRSASGDFANLKEPCLVPRSLRVGAAADNNSLTFKPVRH